jgi:hypothetical protein
MTVLNKSQAVADQARGADLDAFSFVIQALSGTKSNAQCPMSVQCQAVLSIAFPRTMTPDLQGQQVHYRYPDPLSL